MDLTLSPQIKIVALVGAILALGGGASMMLLSRSQGTPAAEPVTTAAAPAAPAPAAAATTTATAPHASPAKPAAATTPAVAAKPRRVARKPAVAANGLPTPLDELLHTHRIVVVSLYDGEAPSDKLARDEAHAGALDSGAGFLGVNVLDERVSAPLTAVAGNGTLLPAPGILVYRRPGVLMNRIDGFADRVAVAETVANALVAQTPSVPAVTNATTTATAAP